MKKTVSGILFVLLLVSMFIGAFNIRSAHTQAYPTVSASEVGINGAVNAAGYVAKPKDAMTTLSTAIGVNETAGLELTMRLEKTEYILSEPINITFTLTNISNQTINLYVGAWTFDFQVFNDTNNVIFQYSTSQIFPLWMMNVQIAPGKNLTDVSVWQQVCNQTAFSEGVPVSPGTYYIVGQIRPFSNILLQTSSLQITAIPALTVVSSKTVVGQGQSISINVTVANLGSCTEDFNVTVYANTTVIGERQIALANGNSTVIPFTWKTASFAYSHYNLTAYASPVINETNAADSRLAFGIVTVTILGDTNGDGTVNVLDLIMIATLLGQSNGGGTVPYSSHWYQWMNCDLNGDGKINILDLIMCATHMQQHW